MTCSYEEDLFIIHSKEGFACQQRVQEKSKSCNWLAFIWMAKRVEKGV